MTRHEHGGIAAVLTSARGALLAGNLSELSSLSVRLEQSVETAMPTKLGDVRLIKQMAEENGHLLVAALKGVRAARQRLRDLSEQGRFSTYASNGQRYQPGLDIETPARRF